MDEIDIAVEPDTVGAGDNVDSRRHRLSKRVALVAGLVMRNVLAMGNLSLSSQFLGKATPPEKMCAMTCSVHEILHVEGNYKRLMPFIDEKHPFEGVCEYFGFKLGKAQKRGSKVARGVLLERDGDDVPVCFKLYGYNRLRRSLQRLFKALRWSGNQLTFNFFMVWVYQHVRLLRVVNTGMC